MNVSCLRSALREGLRIVSGVVDPRNIKPILQDIRLRTVENGLELSATDLEVGMKYVVRDVETKQEGGLVVPADPLAGIVSESRDERLGLSVTDSHLLVEGQSSRFKVMGISEEDFPEIPDFPEGKALEIEGAVLREMIEKTIFAVAVERQRYALNGVLLVAEERKTRVEMVGTDGRRMASIRRKANGASPFSASAIVPLKALQQVQKMVHEEEIVKIFVQERQILFKTETAVLAAQLVEGRFPEYREVIPNDCNKRLEVGGEEFANGLRQAAVLSARDSRAVRLCASREIVTLDSSDPESGEAHVEVAVKYEGEPIEIRFNPDFLIDGIKAIGDQTIRFEMKDAARAAVMRTASDYVYLIMPITQE